MSRKVFIYCFKSGLELHLGTIWGRVGFAGSKSDYMGNSVQVQLQLLADTFLGNRTEQGAKLILRTREHLSTD